MSKWNHRICERCWFDQEPDRMPVQVLTEYVLGLTEDPQFAPKIHTCCKCGKPTLGEIFVRFDPNECVGNHQEDE